MQGSEQLTDLQLAIVRILWARGECSVAQVQEGLRPGRALAQTTVATILSRLERRGVVRHSKRGRLFLYEARVSEPQVRLAMVRELTKLLFEGRAASLVSYLLASDELRARDLAELRALLAEAEGRLRPAPPAVPSILSLSA